MTESAGSQVETEATRSPVAGEARWEFRPLTVLFCDIVGSTALMEALDVDDYSAAVQRFYAVCTAAIRAHNGEVAQYQGDAVIGQFGLPYAAEDDAERAVRTALEILRDVQRVALPEGQSLAARAGIASGRVKMNLAQTDFGANVIGPSVTLAGRMQQLADSGSVVICSRTRKLIGGLFTCRDQGEQPLKGFSEPQQTFEVVKERAVPTGRFDALRAPRAGSLIGRDASLKCLIDALRAAKSEQGSAYTIVAPAGFGKSRLLKAAQEHPEAETCRFFHLHCAPETQTAPLHPIRELVEWVAGVTYRHSAEERHAAVDRLLGTVWGLPDARRQDLRDLLSPLGSADDGSDDTAVLRRQRAFTELRNVLLRSGAGKSALVLTIEDLHWADPSTVEFLNGLAGQIQDQPVLLLSTTRPEGAGRIKSADSLTLERLSDADAFALAQHAASRADLPSDVVAALVEKAEGVPLYIEEYADMLAETARQRDSVDQLGVPHTLETIVRSRLDALPSDVQDFARVAAAYGRRFNLREVGLIAGLDADTAKQAADQLCRGRLAEPLDTERRDTVQFTHGLVREAIYAAIDAGWRRTLHRAIAEHLADGHAAARVGNELIASHYEAAEEYQPAVAFLIDAARDAARGGAAAEALTHVDEALRALRQLPNGAERDRLELQVRSIQGPTLMVTQGPGSADFGEVQAKALSLSHRLNQRAQAVPIIYNCALHAWASGDFERARELAQRIEAVHYARPHEAAYLAYNTMYGLIAWHQGANARAKVHLEAVVDTYDGERHRDLYAEYLKDFGVFARFYLALSLTTLGESEAGRAYAADALSLARALRRPHPIGFAMLAQFNCAILRGDTGTAAEVAEETVAYAERQGFPEFVAMARFARGWCACANGEAQAGLRVMADGRAAWAATGFVSWRPILAALHAQALARHGEAGTAEEVLDAHPVGAERQANAPHALACAMIARENGRNDAARDWTDRALMAVGDQHGAAWRAQIRRQVPDLARELDARG